MSLSTFIVLSLPPLTLMDIHEFPATDEAPKDCHNEAAVERQEHRGFPSLFYYPLSQ